tara:strand:+ start:90411 stop:91316 length:906 start_codon:yes stop_codon:yes gene_type:complete
MRKLHKAVLFLCCLVVVSNIYGQATDLARIEYTNFPQSSSDNSFSRLKTFLKFPIKLNEKGAYLVPGIQYQNVNFQLKDETAFSKEELDHFQSYAFSLGYTFKMSEDWRFGIEGEVDATSNFVTRELTGEDLEYTGSIYFIKSKSSADSIGSWRLILGARYSTATSIRFPIPIVNYFKRYDEKWSYTLGVPKTNIKHNLNDKHSFQAFASVDGFYANLQNKINPAGNLPYTGPLGQNISITTVLTGLGYEFQFSKYFSFYIYGGHSIINNIRLRDEHQDRVYTINDTNSIYGRTGLKFSIL